MHRLQRAHALLSKFRAGEFATQQATEEHVELVQLLAQEYGLRPKPFDQQVLAVMQIDSHWNQAAQQVLNEIYQLNTKGNSDQASEMQEKFKRSCPSAWYREIVENAI